MIGTDERYTVQRLVAGSSQKAEIQDEYSSRQRGCWCNNKGAMMIKQVLKTEAEVLVFCTRRTKSPSAE